MPDSERRIPCMASGGGPSSGRRYEGENNGVTRVVTGFRPLRVVRRHGAFQRHHELRHCTPPPPISSVAGYASVTPATTTTLNPKNVPLIAIAVRDINEILLSFYGVLSGALNYKKEKVSQCCALSSANAQDLR